LDLNSLSAALHSIKVSNGTYDLAIDSNGYLTIANSSFAVTASDLDIRDLDYSQDNVAIKSAAGVDLAIDANGYLTITNSSFAVTASDLDIRDLDYSQDNVAIKSAAGVDLSIDANGYLTITNSSFAVTASDLDIRDLDYSQDNVAIKSAAGVDLAIDANGYVTANINGVVATSQAAYDTWKVTAQTVTNTASQLCATALTDRTKLVVQNLGSQDVYVNFSNAVSTTNGLLIAKGFSQEIELAAAANIWAITGSGSANVRLAEYSF
jgi:ethanolamine utilization microcompartment shell protein EutS